MVRNRKNLENIFINKHYHAQKRWENKKKLKMKKKKKKWNHKRRYLWQSGPWSCPLPPDSETCIGSLVRMGLRHGAPCGKYYSSKNECRKFARPKWLLLLFIWRGSCYCTVTIVKEGLLVCSTRVTTVVFQWLPRTWEWVLACGCFAVFCLR